MLRHPAPSVGPDQWNPVQKRGYKVVPKEPSWPRDTFGEKLARGGLARRLGTRGPRILGTLGWSGSPGMLWESWGGLRSWEILGPERSWDHLGDPGIAGQRVPRSLYIQLPIHRPRRPLS